MKPDFFDSWNYMENNVYLNGMRSESKIAFSLNKYSIFHISAGLILAISILFFTSSCMDTPPLTGIPDPGLDTPIYSVTTWAGSKKGLFDGKGEEARFNYPWGVAVSTRGDLYIGDSNNFNLRYVDRDRNVEILAGGEILSGHTNGEAEKARFSRVMGVALGTNGDLFVADSENNLIRKVSHDGVVETLAGNLMPGFRDGKGDEAFFSNPADVASTFDMTLFVADAFNHSIRQITPDGTVTTLAGTGRRGYRDGGGDVAQFTLPLGVDIGPDEEYLYVTEFFGHRIRQIHIESGEVTTIAGNGTAGFEDGHLGVARLHRPMGIAVAEDGAIYFSDSGNNAIRMIRDGIIKTIAGNGQEGNQDGVGQEARFSKPYHIELNVNETFLFVSDWNNHRIRKVQVQ